MNEKLFAEAKDMACEIAFRVGVMLTEDEEASYARKTLANYDASKPLYRQVMNVIANDF